MESPSPLHELGRRVPHGSPESPGSRGQGGRPDFELGDDAVAAVDAEADGTVSGNGFRHITVLLHETVDMLKAGPGKFIVDCTLGGGGHTELLLEQGATVWGIDRDADARRAAMLRLARFGSRFKVLAGNFQDVESILSQQGVSRVDGLLADLGVSSHQLDTASRGFSFREDGPLDMRMDTRAALSARNLVNEAPEEEIAISSGKSARNALPAPLPAP